MVSYSKHHFNAWVSNGLSGLKWRLTTIYEHLEVAKRCEVWKLLKFISTSIIGLWLCFGDFNKILVQYEKQGGRNHVSGQLIAFREFIDYCGFKARNTDGSLFTWSNTRDGVAHIQERLDRLLANADWLSLFLGFHIRNFTTSYSNHSCFILNTIG